MIHNNLEEFSIWYKDFVSKRGGTKIHPSWYTRCIEAHKEFSEKVLGGVYSKRFDIEIDNKDGAIPMDVALVFANDIQTIIPRYFVDYNFSTHDIRRSIIRPERTEYAGMKVTTHINRYFDWKHKNDADYAAKKEKLSNLLAKLGGKWTESKTNKLKTNVLVSCEPIAFAMIGHYGVDPKSCFRQGGCNNVHKYIVGQNPNTFVMILSSIPDENVESFFVHDCPAHLARCWGIKGKDDFHINNFYLRNEEQRTVLLSTIDKTVANLMGVETVAKLENNHKIDTIYQNPKDNFSIGKTKYSIPVGIGFNLSHSEITAGKECYYCKFVIPANQARSVTGYWMCDDCSKNLKICEFEKKPTIYDLVDAIDLDGRKIKISSHLIGAGYFFKCNKTNKIYHAGTKIRVGDMYVSSLAANELGIKHCEICDDFCFVTDEINGRKTCIKCRTYAKRPVAVNA